MGHVEMRSESESRGTAIVGIAFLTVAAALIGVRAFCPPLHVGPEQFEIPSRTHVGVPSPTNGVPECAVAIVDAAGPGSNNDGFESAAPIAEDLHLGNDYSQRNITNGRRNPAPTSTPPPLAAPLLC